MSNRLLSYGVMKGAGMALALLGWWSGADAGEGERTQPPPSVVERVDLVRYSGLWYEIAKIPNPFQARCSGDTTARYSLREDGRIEVLNRCLDSEGNPLEAKGIARVVDPGSNAKLKVSFVRLLGVFLFWGDYWILGLGRDYVYALVGHPDRRYGWILSRTPVMGEEALKEAFTILREKGYDPRAFEMTRQGTRAR